MTCIVPPSAPRRRLERRGRAVRPLRADRRSRAAETVLRPRLVSFSVFLALLLMLWGRSPSSDTGTMTLYVTVFWSIPALLVGQGLVGAVIGVTHARRTPRTHVCSPVADQLVVVVPTVARKDTAVALERVVRSFVEQLPVYFDRVRVDLVVDEGAAGLEDVERLARMDDHIRVVVVPDDYRTPRGTRFKARANHYAHLQRLRDGEARNDVWVLHMDDDTSVGADTAIALADFVAARRADRSDGIHLVQGVLTYPRELARSRLTWLADAVRPGCDISIFAAWTGNGAPRAGLHGELLCVRGSVEAQIGWDFGPRSTVEDADFALRFCRLFPRGSTWFRGRSYGASPATVGDFVRQRARWVCGLLELALTAGVPLRSRAVLVHNVTVWLCAPMGSPAVVLLMAVAMQDAALHAPSLPVYLVWAVSMAFYLYLYWEGLRLNVMSSASPRRCWWESVAVLSLTPVFALLESLGILLGLVRALGGRDAEFTVITKPL